MRCIVLWIPAYAGMTVGFAKVSVKGEGDSVGCVVLFVRVTLPPLWIADQVRNDVTMLWHCFHPLIPCQGLGHPHPSPLPSRERGILAVVLSCCCPAHPALRIDESLITLCQRVRLQRGKTSFFIILVP